MASNTVYMEEDCGVIHAIRGSNAYVIVLDFAGIGKNGDFRGPMEYWVEKWQSYQLYQAGCVRISRNKVPQVVKDFFKKAIPLVDEGKHVVMNGRYEILRIEDREMANVS